MKNYILVLFFLLSNYSSLLGQDSVGNEKTPPIGDVPGIINAPPSFAEYVPVKTKDDLYLSIGILVFFLIISVMLLILFLKKNYPFEPSLRYFTLILVVGGATFSVAAGFGDKQISTLIGFFGTLAGYLLAKLPNPKTYSDSLTQNSPSSDSN